MVWTIYRDKQQRETHSAFDRTKIFCEAKKFGKHPKNFSTLHGFAKREHIQFSIQTMLETLILQGCIVRNPIEYTMTHQKIGSVGTVFANVSLITEFAFLIIKLTFHLRTRLHVAILN